MPEEIGSPERHLPAACPVRRHLGGSSFLRMTGWGNPPIGTNAPWQSESPEIFLCAKRIPLILLCSSAVVSPFWFRLGRAGPLRFPQRIPVSAKIL